MSFFDDIGDELYSICRDECDFNKSLPELRTNFCVPLAAMARSSRTTAFIAKSILVMLVPNGRAGKLIQVFESTLYPRSQNDEDDVCIKCSTIVD